MSWRFRLSRMGLRCATLLSLVLLAELFAPVAAQAQGGLALSGSFYRQDFVIPQGSSASGLGINVVVFNNGSEVLKVRMTSQTPPGVNISLSSREFDIAPRGQQQVLVGVAVAADAVPGDYEISITAESYKEGATGIQLAGAAAQNAKLTVTGQSARVTLRATSPDGQPVVATVRLYRTTGGQSLEIAYSETGTLEAKMAPGNFTAASYIGGNKVAEQSFNLAENDQKTIILTGATVYFESFGIVPNYLKDSGKLAFLQIVYNVKNLYQRVARGEVFLQVNVNGTAQKPLSLATLSPLEVGSAGTNYNYIPDGGWMDGSYDFKLQLSLDGQPYTYSAVQSLKVGGGVVVTGGNTPASGEAPTGQPASGGGGMSVGVIGGIAAAIVALAGIAFLVMNKTRRK